MYSYNSRGGRQWYSASRSLYQAVLSLLPPYFFIGGSFEKSIISWSDARCRQRSAVGSRYHSDGYH